jgi:transcriptional regulator with XRE-family HTH domain
MKEPKFRRGLLDKDSLEARGLSRTTLAAACQCSVDALRGYHKGTSVPGGTILARMAQAFSTPDQLVTSDWLMSTGDLQPGNGLQ